MADITATQKQALSGMNMSDHEERMKELEAELEAVKARIAETKANIANLKADQKLIETAQTQNRGLEGERGEDGSLLEVPITKSNEEMDAQYMEEIKALDLKPNSPENNFHNKEVLHQMAENWSMGSFGNTPDGEEMLIPDRVLVINSPEFQEIYGDAYDSIAAPLEVTITKGAEEDDMITEKQIADPEDDIEGDERTDAESERQQFMGILREGSGFGKTYERHGTGRTFAVEDDLPERSMGFEDKDGYMSINEKDDFWKTQEGYDKAIEMYGSKPAWVKEPTLIWNPVEQKYEEIEEEEFEDLSRPAISADIRKLLG